MASLTEQDLPSDSDDSDADFKPSDEGSAPSEEDSDGSVEEPSLQNEDELETTEKGKRKKKQAKHRKKGKKMKLENNAVNEEEAEKEKEADKKISPEEEKKKMDSLWSDFMKDCSPPVRKLPSVTNSTNGTDESAPLVEKKSVIEKENKAVVEEIFEFAGEKVKVEREVPAQTSGRGRGGVPAGPGRGRGRGRGGGLADLVGKLGKNNKLSTLEKSKLDWERFKKQEGIQEDIQTHNKGKEGYLEKQDFLQRTDLRQFEIEKQLRTTSRRSNR